MADLTAALGPAFAAGFAVQQLLEILDPVLTLALEKIPQYKKPILGLLSFGVGYAIASSLSKGVLANLGMADAGGMDTFVTALIISAGSEGFNSIVKFVGYAKNLCINPRLLALSIS